MKEKTTFSAQKIKFFNTDFKINALKKEPDGIGKNFHEELEIKLFYEGDSVIMIDGEVYNAVPKSIAVINPYEIHTNVNIERYNGKYYLVNLDLDFFKNFSPFGLDLRQELLSKGKRFVNYIESDKTLCELIYKVYEELTLKKENYRLVVFSLLTELFVILFREYLKKEKTQVLESITKKGAELISPALAKIFKDYNKPLSVESLAHECGITKYHFCRVFKKEMKMTAIEYLNNYRISIAEVMLKNLSLSTEEIAFSCGFNDVSYFYRCYKKLKNKSLKRKEYI